MQKDLSVQVHPNDEFANIHENGELGKTECWYIIDCKKMLKWCTGILLILKKNLRA